MGAMKEEHRGGREGAAATECEREWWQIKTINREREKSHQANEGRGGGVRKPRGSGADVATVQC